MPLALNDLIVTTLRHAANDALMRAVTLKFTPAPASALPIVYGDLVQIQQVILNLLTTAITAAAASGGPRARMHPAAVSLCAVKPAVSGSTHGPCL